MKMINLDLVSMTEIEEKEFWSRLEAWDQVSNDSRLVSMCKIE